MSNKTQLTEKLDSTPLAATVLTDQTLHERFTEGTVITLIEMVDFSNVGDPEPLYVDGKRQYGDNKEPMFTGKFRYAVYDDNQEVIGYFKLTVPDISWSVIKVITNHYTNETDGSQWLYFKVVNKVDTIADAKNFVIGEDALLEMKELI